MKKAILILLICGLLLTSSCYASNDDAWKENTGSINLSEKTTSLDEGIEFSENNISITKGGDYTVSGNLTDGMIYINTTEKVKLRLNGVNISNSLGPAIFFDNAQKGFITIEENTENYISDGTSQTETEADAAIFSNDDLEIKGNGSLTISGNYKHGIASDDDVSVQNGNITITCIEHGIKANNKVEITGGNINISSNGGKGLKADDEIVIEGGLININEAEEGMESEGTIVINDGTLNINASDDGINTGNANDSTNTGFGGMRNPGERPQKISGEAPQMPDFAEGEMMPRPNGEMMPRPNGKMGSGMFGMVDEETAAAHAITINGGTISITAKGDGIDSNGNLLVTGGTVTINGPEGSGNGAIDYAGTFSITGGDVITLSSAGMVGLPNSDETQSTLSITFSEKREAGSTVTVKDADGNEIASKTAENTYQHMMLSSDDLEEGKEYNIYIDNSLIETITAASGVTRSGNSMDNVFGGGRGGQGGMKPGRSRFNGENGVANQTGSNIKIKLNGSHLKFNQAPVIKNGTTLVPLRSIFEALGMEVTWDDETKTVTATKNDTVITLQIGNKVASVNGSETTLNTEPEIISDSTMVPVRFISESVGLNVDWNEELMEVSIS